MFNHAVHQNHTLCHFIDADFEVIFKENQQGGQSLLEDQGSYLVYCLRGKMKIFQNVGDKSATFFNHQYNYFVLVDGLPITMCAVEDSIYCILKFNACFLKKQRILKDEALQTLLLTQTFQNFLSTQCHFNILYPILRCLEQLLGSQLEQYYQQELIYVKVQELFLLFAQQTKKKACVVDCKIKDYHIEKIHQAKKIVETTLKEPCSLLQIAKKVGLNDCTLKRGFKEIYGTTIFGYLAEKRMAEAQRLLLKNTYSIAEIAEIVGYTNSSNFINAFKKRFLCSPKQFILKNAPVSTMEVE